MRLLFCLDEPNQLNGPNVWLTRLLPLLQKQGFAVEVLYLTDKHDFFCCYREFFEGQGIHTRSVNIDGTVEECAATIVEALSGDLPDIFVPNCSIHAYYAARFLREAGVATIGVLHSDDPYYHDIADYFVTGDSHWQLSGVVGVSDFIISLITNNKLCPIPYLHAPCGVPVSSTFAQGSSGTLRLVYTGRLVELQKRIGRLTHRFVDAVQKWPNVEAVLYGSGLEEALVAEIIANARVGGRVKLGGAISPEAMYEELSHGHVFVLLSDFEGLPIALMEAMACGLVPVVGRIDSGVTDLITHGENGFIVDADNSGEFLNAIGDLIQNPELWEKLSIAARQRILDGGYTADACAQKWADYIYEKFSQQQPKTVPIIPPIDKWNMPPESTREGGLRYVENRSITSRLLSVELNSRPLYLWGAGSSGLKYLKAIDLSSMPIHGFIDSDAEKQGSIISGFKIYSPAILDSRTGGEKPFVVITSCYGREIAGLLESKGLHHKVDFI